MHKIFLQLGAIFIVASDHDACCRLTPSPASSLPIQLIERLYRLRWGPLDGLGALVISPTRELALQIFDELRKVGRRHEFSAGLLIGGKDLAEEADLVAGMNILVATPGRLLQHMDETPGFDAGGLQVLVMDEADRILDMVRFGVEMSTHSLHFIGRLHTIALRLPSPLLLPSYYALSRIFHCYYILSHAYFPRPSCCLLSSLTVQGFSATINAVVANLPRQRQTLLFSATQTKSVSALARLSLSAPEYVAAHAEAEAPTPVRLEQAFMEINLEDKLDVLWSFIKTHLKCRVIVFLSTCKQVRFVYEAFRRLRPGTPLRALHGRMSQYKRMGVYQQFCDAKASVLFATDIVARGLDFPSVDWVVQADCPEDTAAYIHRVGRTARYTSAGRGLLLLLPSEKPGMVAALEDAKITIKQLKHNPAKIQPVTPALQALLSKDAELKEVAQRALVSYLRSVFLQPNKKVFDVTKLPAAEFALSMGLPTAPKLRFLRRGAPAAGRRQEAGEEAAARGQRGPDDDDEASSSEEDSDSGSESDKEAADKAMARGGKAENGGRAHGFGAAADVSGSDDDDLLVVKTRHTYDDAPGAPEAPLVDAPIAKRKKRLKINPGKTTGTRVVFDDEGKAVAPLELLARGDGHGSGDEGQAEEGRGLGSSDGGMREGLHTGVHASVAERAEAARAVMLARDRGDKAALRELRKSQRDAKRAKRLARGHGGDGPVAVLGSGGGSDDEAWSSEEESEEEGRVGRGQGDDFEADVDLLSDSEDSEVEGKKGGAVGGKGKRKAQAQGNVEVATMGMLAVKGGGGGKKRQKKEGGAEGMSLAEQEALALHLLRKKS